MALGALLLDPCPVPFWRTLPIVGAGIKGVMMAKAWPGSGAAVAAMTRGSGRWTGRCTIILFVTARTASIDGTHHRPGMI